jgi:hypothetical protein
MFHGWNPAVEAWPGGPHPGAIAAMEAQAAAQQRAAGPGVGHQPALDYDLAVARALADRRRRRHLLLASQN